MVFVASFVRSGVGWDGSAWRDLASRGEMLRIVAWRELLSGALHCGWRFSERRVAVSRGAILRFLSD